MSAIEKLVKAFEALKVFNASGVSDEAILKKKDIPLTKKDKISHCQTIADAIVSPNLRIVSDFHKFLGITIDTFLMCCDDNDSDVRMTADECLNRVIRALTDSNLGRIQVELYKEIKKNGQWRSLRAALWRFSELCVLIRPQKCRPYVVNLLPCLMVVAQRQEETLQEVLATAIRKIFVVLGKFTNDTETKSLLKSFLPNLKSSSAIMRRTAASCLTVICENSRKPFLFTSWLFSTLLELIVPIQQDAKEHTLLGILLCFRHLLPLLAECSYKQPDDKQSNRNQENVDPSCLIDQYLQVYEMLLFYSQHIDHNVVTASLEALNQLLLKPPKQLIPYLVNRGMITHSKIYSDDVDENGAGAAPVLRGRTMSQLSMNVGNASYDADVEDLADDPELPINSQTTTSASNESIGTSSEEAFEYTLQSSGAERPEIADSDDSNEDVSEYSNIPVKYIQKVSCDIASIELYTGPLDSSDEIKMNSARNDSFSQLDAVYTDFAEPSPIPGSVTFQVGDIGSFVDDEVPLMYCARLLSSSFLLTGSPESLMPDRNVRVSVKSLALHCLASVLNLQPQVFFCSLFKPTSNDPLNTTQWIKDVLLFSKHSDPRLRGSASTLLGTYLKSALSACGCEYEVFAKDELYVSDVSLKSYISIILSLVVDESSVAARMGLQALKTSLPIILHSVRPSVSLNILNTLIDVKKNPYWLVKVELLELLSSVDYNTVSYLELQSAASTVVSRPTSSVNLQWRVVNEVIMYTLGDEDHRVRLAAAQSLLKIIPRMFYPSDHNMHDPIISAAKNCTNELLDPIIQQSSDSQIPDVHILAQPFDSLWKTKKHKGIGCNMSLEGILTRIIDLVCHKLVTSTVKHLTFGCIQALNLLSEEYKVTTYLNAWSIVFSEENPVLNYSSLQCQSSDVASSRMTTTCDVNNCPEAGLLSYLLSIVSSSSLSLDISVHQNILQLTGNLLAGASYQCLVQRNSNQSVDSTSDTRFWSSIQDNHVSMNLESMKVHLMRLLNIYTHVIEEFQPGPQQVKPSLPSLPVTPSLSPVKRKVKPKEESSLNSASSVNVKNSPVRQTAPELKLPVEKEKSIQNKMAGIGTFYNLTHYMKLFEVLRGAYSSYKISLDVQSSEKLIGLIKVCLKSMCQLLEIASVDEMGKCAEELLNYLKYIMLLEPAETIHCVQQFLKSLFGTNLASWFDGSNNQSSSAVGQSLTNAITTSRKPGHATRLNSNPQLMCGLYHNCFTMPYTQLTQSLSPSVKSSSAAGLELSDDIHGNSWMSWLRKKGERKMSAIVKTGAKSGDKSSLASYIRLFEPLVIKALKQYTVTSLVDLQAQVLDLLAQLVQLRVNYCLLDSEKIFLGFVIKQFEYIEEGQIPCASRLIPHIFYFLVLLSYERYHSKFVIGVPKIIQLCDGIMASGQSSIEFAVPALQPVVDDLFTMRTPNKSDSSKELETQREVVISMLFRLMHHHQVLEMFLLVLKQSHKDGEDRWKKLSRQIIDGLLPQLVKQLVMLNSLPALNVLHKLFEDVSPSVFRPVDILLKALFTAPQRLDSTSKLERWICLVLASLRVIISQSKEEVVLSRLAELGLQIKSWPIVSDDHTKTEINCLLTPEEELPPAEETIARYLFQSVGMLVSEIRQMEYQPCKKENNVFLCQQAAHLMLYITHMFQSGMFRRVATAAMSMVKSSSKDVPDFFYTVQKINRLFQDLSVVHPTLTLQWCNILILLNYDDHLFWTEVLRAKTRRSTSSPKHMLEWTTTSANSCNVEMVRKGGLILFCDYVCENPNDAEQMTWLIVNHVNELIMLSSEPPVHDFLCAIHRNSAASGLLVQAIYARCDDLSNPSFVRKTLQNLEAIHLSQTGSLLMLLIDKFLATHQLSLARTCNSMVCHRLEMLLAETQEEAAAQMPVDDIDKLFSIMKKANLVKKHARLVTLLGKLRSMVAPDLPLPEEFNLESSHRFALPPNKESHPLGASSPRQSTLTKDWYVSVVKKECCNHNAVSKVCAKLLSCLEYRDIIGIMALKDFNLNILHDCLLVGLRLTVDISQKEKSSPSSESSVSSPLVPAHIAYSSNHEHPVYQAARVILLQQVSHIINLLPRPHQIRCFGEEVLTFKETKYKSRIMDLFTDGAFVDTLFQIIPSLTCYLNTLRHLPSVSDVQVDSLTDIARFCVLCIEITYVIIGKGDSIPYQFVSTALIAVSTILKNSTLSGIIGLKEHVLWTTSMVGGLYRIVDTLLKDEKLPSVKKYFPESTNPEVLQSFKACEEMSVMVAWLESLESRDCKQIPTFIVDVLKSVVKGMGRLPLVNSYARTPTIAWEMNWMPEFGGEFSTSVPPPSGEYLQECDVLKQYVYRVNALGWTSRQQFEETWMALLGVLSATPIGPTASIEDEERIQTSCLAVKCITSLLLQTMMLPQPGNPHNSNYLQQHRNKPLGFLHTRRGKKLMAVRGTLAEKLSMWNSQWDAESFIRQKNDQIFDINFEKVSSPNTFSVGQVSLEYIWTAAGMMDEEVSEVHDAASSSSSSATAIAPGSEEYHQRERSLAAYGLDIHSCLHFLLDLYSQWMMSLQLPPPQGGSENTVFSKTPVSLLMEVTRSVVLLSDIFTERAQFEWMQDIMLELTRIHPPEDEIMSQYLIVGICKSVAVLNMESEMVDRLRKLIELNLKSTYLPVRICTLHGILYLLQAGSGDGSAGYVPTAVDYIVRHLDNSSLPSSQSEEHVLVMWSVVFYILENHKEDLTDVEITQKIFQIAVHIISSQTQNVPYQVYKCVIHGLERLLLTDSLSSKDIDVLLKLSRERLRMQNPNEALPAAGLLVSCMYSVHSEKHSPQKASDSVGSSISESFVDDVGNDHETIITAMERATILFDRIRKGFPYEAEIISCILPTFLTDFFPAQEILNKIIGEFLSNQQPHPQLMAMVVFKVFESLHLQSQQLLIQDWVMLSLSNFTQRSPVSMAIWSLTCFFVSASTNSWLRSLFPLVQQRIGQLDAFDCELFCRSALDFRDQLMDESQRKSFKLTIQAVAEPNTPYINLLSSL